MNPEFLREGSALDDFLHPDRIVIGQWDEKSGEMLGELYRGLNCPVLHTSLRNAEMIKYAANSLLATLISFSNEIAALCEATPGTDSQTVMQGVHLDRRLSLGAGGERIHPGILSFLAAGCGFGGSCLPKDLNALPRLCHGVRRGPGVVRCGGCGQRPATAKAGPDGGGDARLAARGADCSLRAGVQARNRRPARFTGA